MSVKKEPSGRRSVQIEIEVPGTPEEVWQAIATGPGISSWMVPSEFEEQGGKPVAVKMNFGPGMEIRSPVTAWEPLKKWVAQVEGMHGSPPVANEWIVEARAGGVCVVRIVQSLFASTDEWDNQLEAGETVWLAFFRALRIYLTHFRGQPSTIMQFVVPFAGTEAEAWECADRGGGCERPDGRTAVDGARGRPGVRRRGGVLHRESVRRPAAARRTRAGHRRPRRLQLRRPEHGRAELLPVRRSSGRDRRPPDSALGRMVSKTFPDADGAEQEPMTAFPSSCALFGGRGVPPTVEIQTKGAVMSVKKEPSGRRSVQIEIEVPGTPEEVWQAIATGPGISSWFVPTEFEERDGKPVAMKLNFGAGMEPRSKVTAWDPPRLFATEADGWMPGCRPSRTSGPSKHAREASASSALSKAFSPARTIGTTSWKAPSPDCLVSWPSCGSISRTSAANARR